MMMMFLKCQSKEKVQKVNQTVSRCLRYQRQPLRAPPLSHSLVSTQDSGGDVTAHSSQLEVQSIYSFSRIRSFLQETKGMRLLKVEEYFPDLQLFLDSVKFFTKMQDAGVY